jgi:hypothetical protein
MDINLLKNSNLENLKKIYYKQTKNDITFLFDSWLIMSYIESNQYEQANFLKDKTDYGRRFIWNDVTSSYDSYLTSNFDYIFEAFIKTGNVKMFEVMKEHIDSNTLRIAVRLENNMQILDYLVQNYPKIFVDSAIKHATYETLKYLYEKHNFIPSPYLLQKKICSHSPDMNFVRFCKETLSNEIVSDQPKHDFIKFCTDVLKMEVQSNPNN